MNRDWSFTQEEIDAMENEYLQQLPLFERIVSTHWMYCVGLAFLCNLAFGVGLLIGKIL